MSTVALAMNPADSLALKFWLLTLAAMFVTGLISDAIRRRGQRIELAKARRIYGFDLTDDERARWIRNGRKR